MKCLTLINCLALIVAVGMPSIDSIASAATLKVCADPDYMPYSDKAGEGFENKIAELAAKALNSQLVYDWASYRGNGGFSEFLSRTLDAGKCDVVIGIPYGSQEELTTDPYYASSYVFIFKKGRGYDVENMDSAILRKVKLGFEEGTPPQDGLKIRDLIFDAEAFHVGDDAGISPGSMLEAVKNGHIDIMITWEPAIGYFLKNYSDLRVVRVPNTRAMGSPEQYMFSIAMGVRKNDELLCTRLNSMIAAHKAEIRDILDRFNVRLYPAATDNP
jgi:mxaJ protein